MSLPAFLQMPVGGAWSTILPDMDFETFSLAGYVWEVEGTNPKKPLGRWKALPGAREKGLFAVGTRVYAEHPSTEVLTLSYDLKDGKGKRRWRPGLPLPLDLFAYLASGKPIEAHHAMFERAIWTFVCQRKYGFPPVNPAQWRCSSAKARAFGLPGALGDLGKVLKVPTQKDAEGKRLIKLLSIPRDPTKTDPRVRITPAEVPEDAERMYGYCDTDIEVESQCSQMIPDLIPQELDYWQCDQAINFRGVGVDLAAVRDCIKIVDQVLAKYGAEMLALTGGLEPTQVEKLKGWLIGQGVPAYLCDSLDEEAMGILLAREDLPPIARRALELRALCSSASVKKVYAMLNHATQSGRLCDLFIYHGARTGRDTHADVQPGNLPKAGPDLRWCDNVGCGAPYLKHRSSCPWCNTSAAFSREESPEGAKGWTWEAAEHALQVIATGSVEAVEYVFGDALLTVSGVVRSLLVAADRMRLICSDYSSIEAVVTAAIAGEEWRLEAFERREDIYLHGAASVTGKTYDWYMANGGKKHPDRQKLGKPAELGLGFGGWFNAWLNFGGEGTKEEVTPKLQAWRDSSPNIVEAWGGQLRGKPWAPDRYEYYGLEGAAVQAVLNPGQVFSYRMISYQAINDCLYCLLPSGRRLAYHEPRLQWEPPKGRKDWAPRYTLTYMTWNTNPKMGPMGWVRMETYGGRLFENVVQAVARDIMAFAVINLERASYPIVLRVHDELAAEVPLDFGSVEEFEHIMATLPPWAYGWPSDPTRRWPIRAAGGWAGHRYRKD